MTTKKITDEDTIVAIPGDQLGVIEEFAPQKNCYERDGIIIAEYWGTKKIDHENHVVSVMPLKKIFMPRHGTIALGYVTEIRKQNASLILSHFRLSPKSKKFFPVNSTYPANLHITNISERYIRNLYDGIRPGDYVFCKILSTDPEIRISIFGERELGVVYAACFACGHEITRTIKRNLLRCGNCGATQSRVLSSEFGKLFHYFPR